MAYTVKLTGSSAFPREDVEGYLLDLPGITRDAGLLLYTDGDVDLEAEIRPLLSGDKAEGLEVSTADPLTPPAAEALASFCAAVARHYEWEVQDPTTGQDLGEAAIRTRFAGGSLTPLRSSGCLSALLLYAVGLVASR